LEELQAATLEDAFAFYREYYRPDNAALVVVGDFKQDDLDKWVDKYFGRLKNPSTTIKRDYPEEPEKTESVKFEKTAPNVKLPSLGMTYLAPPSTSKDVAAIEVATAILDGGESSRLYQSLIYKQQIAQQASLFADIRSDKGILAFWVIAAGGKKLEDIEKSVLAEVRKLQETPPSEKELEKAKNSLVTSILRAREDVNGKAVAIGEAIIYKNDAKAVNRDVDALNAVTAEDVSRIMKTYFRENGRTVIYYTGETAGNGGDK
jgi:zinc protease